MLKVALLEVACWLPELKCHKAPGRNVACRSFAIHAHVQSVQWTVSTPKTFSLYCMPVCLYRQNGIQCSVQKLACQGTRSDGTAVYYRLSLEVYMLYFNFPSETRGSKFRRYWRLLPTIRRYD